MSEILVGYDWKNHPVIKTLVEHGPKGLLELPEASGFYFEENRYIDKCHLCEGVRKTVKPEYPEMFV